MDLALCLLRRSSQNSLLRSCERHFDPHTRRAQFAEKVRAGTMSHLKVLRGNLAQKILSFSKNGKRPKVNRLVSNPIILNRCLATQTAPEIDNKFLTSPWGEIEVGKETLTEHVFSDFELWADKPCVVSILIQLILFAQLRSIFLYLVN